MIILQLLITKRLRGSNPHAGHGLRDEFDGDSSEDDEGGVSENVERDVEEPIAPIPGNSATAAGPPTAIANDGSEFFDAQDDSELTESESSSSATSLSVSTTGPHTTPSSTQHIHIKRFPSPFAGIPVKVAGSEPVYIQYARQLGRLDNPWAPFNSKLDWEIARWAKIRGPGSTAVTDLLRIDGVRCLNQYSISSAQTKATVTGST